MEGEDSLRLYEFSEGREDMSDVALDDLWNAYQTDTANISDAMYLHEAQQSVYDVLDTASEQAAESLEDIGLEPLDADIHFAPTEYGAEATEDGPIVIGRFSGTDQDYGAVTVLAHEQFHHLMLHGYDVEDHTPREEAMAKVLDLYHRDMLDDEEQRDAVLQAERDLYNNYPGVQDEFGKQLYKRAHRFLTIFDKDLDGPTDARMEQLMDQYVALHRDAL